MIHRAFFSLNNASRIPKSMDLELINIFMFEYLKDYQYIFVSGMQRSGTTPCMRMIQWELEIPQAIWLGERLDLVSLAPEAFKDSRLILHSPGLSHLIHELRPIPQEEIAIIWMKRDQEEIYKSASRMSWDPLPDLKSYNLESVEDSRENIFNLKKAKDLFWEEQKKQILNWYEIEYSTLKEHPLWVEKERRKGFHARQISVNRHIQIAIEEGKMVAPTVAPTEYGDLKSLLEDFPKEKEEPDWTPPWSK